MFDEPEVLRIVAGWVQKAEGENRPPCAAPDPQTPAALTVVVPNESIRRGLPVLRPAIRNLRVRAAHRYRWVVIPNSD